MDASTATMLGSLVTAVATVALCAVTAVLAKETKRLAALTSRPQVVASILPNRVGTGWADLRVENTGNAAAFDISLTFEPPLKYSPVDDDGQPPLHSISVLTPGQGMNSFLCDYSEIIDVVYSVCVSWKVDPHRTERTSLSYVLSIADIKGTSQLDGSDPAVEVEKHLKLLAKSVERVANGQRRLKVDSYSDRDRQNERDDIRRRIADRDTE